jgi:hypothetical protein
MYVLYLLVYAPAECGLLGLQFLPLNKYVCSVFVSVCTCRVWASWPSVPMATVFVFVFYSICILLYVYLYVYVYVYLYFIVFVFVFVFYSICLGICTVFVLYLYCICIVFVLHNTHVCL